MKIVESINRIVIVGCSRFGANIASELSTKNKSVYVIDINAESFSKLAPDFSGFKIIGDATDIDVLKRAEIEKADLFIASTNLDNVNIMVSELVNTFFQTDHIVSRLYDDEKEIVYKDLSIKIIKPTKLSLEAFENCLAY